MEGVQTLSRSKVEKLSKKLKTVNKLLCLDYCIVCWLGFFSVAILTYSGFGLSFNVFITIMSLVIIKIILFNLVKIRCNNSLKRFKKYIKEVQ